jgi:uncharacterized protein (TIGR02145 family)
MKGLIIVIIILTGTYLQAQVKIENLDYFELENKIIVSYDLIGEGTYSIELFYTINNGVSWHGPLDNITGNIYGVTTGKGRYLIYNIMNDQNWLIGEKIKFKIKLLPDSGFFIDQRDGTKYKWVRIGKQIWMGENLKAIVYPDRTPIRIVKSTLTWENLKEYQKACCWYENIKYNATRYGILYTWAAATGNHQRESNSDTLHGVCPDGWHLPGNSEWSQLDNFIYNDKGATKAGRYLRFFGYYAKDAYSFRAITGGYRDPYGKFKEMDYSVYWWSSDSNYWPHDDIYCSNYGCAYYRGISKDDDSFKRLKNYMNSGFYVRCLKD